MRPLKRTWSYWSGSVKYDSRRFNQLWSCCYQYWMCQRTLPRKTHVDCSSTMLTSLRKMMISSSNRALYHHSMPYSTGSRITTHVIGYNRWHLSTPNSIQTRNMNSVSPAALLLTVNCDNVGQTQHIQSSCHLRSHKILISRKHVWQLDLLRQKRYFQHLIGVGCYQEPPSKNGTGSGCGPIQPSHSSVTPVIKSTWPSHWFCSVTRSSNGIWHPLSLTWPPTAPRQIPVATSRHCSL